jgi:hypothetical protein
MSDRAAPQPLPRLHPLEVSELLDEAFDLYRRNFRLLFGIMLVANLPFTLLQVALEPNEAARAILAWLTIVVVLVTNAALTVAAMDRIMGREATLTSAYREALRLFGRLLIATLVYVILSVGLLLVASLPGLAVRASSPIGAAVLISLGVLVALMPISVLLLWSMLLVPVVIIERRGPGALERCRQLARGNLWRLLFLSLGLTLVILIYLAVLGGLAALAAQLTGVNLLEPRAEGDTVGLLVRAGLLLADAVIQSAWLPVLATAQLLLYLDLRVRCEAYDLELLTEAVEARARRAAVTRAGGAQTLLTLLLFLTGFLSIPLCHADPVLGLSEYRASLQQARSSVTSVLRGQGAADWSRTRSRLAATLPRRARVRVPTGQVVDVDDRGLLQELDRAQPSARRAALARFLAAVDHRLAATRPAAPALDPDRAGRVLRGVLSRPEYQDRVEKPSLEERIVQWIVDWLRRLFPQRSRAVAADDRAARAMLAVVVLLLAMLIARVLQLVLPELRRRRAPEAEERPEGEVWVPREPEALLAEAEREAAAGRFREAMRLLYLALVARLDRAGVLPEDRSRTHGELLRALRQAGHDPLSRELAPVTRRLDERLYGGRTATAEDWQFCRSTHEQIERLLCASA